ncbi:metal ABC transporter permease [Candidatus Nanopelagicales bacterium]|nr:metal ABC transporter permease [Candidatus Nanopelagicales bacterium]
MTLLSYDFMQRALMAAVMIGLLAPLIGVFLVQRRLALLGDGMGHVALTGVGLAFLLGTAPIPTALVVAVLGAITIEVIRTLSKTVGDVALALVFYGGIAGGVLLTAISPDATSTSLNQYLFGSLSTISVGDVQGLAVAFVGCLVALLVLWRSLFALSLDSDVAATQGVRVRFTGVMLTVLAAVTVVIGMRTVGLLLVAAIMIVPVAAAQQLTRSFLATALLGSALGLLSAVGGLVASFYLDLPPGPTIVLIALALFVVSTAGRIPMQALHRATT